MTCIGIMSNPTQPDMGAAVDHLANRMAKRRVKTLLADNLRSISKTDAGRFCSMAELVAQVDVVIALGGDGTLLRAAEQVQNHGTPILGVNMGRLGFLSGAESAEFETELDRLLDGDFAVEERMALTATVGDRAIFALNEVVIERAVSARMVRVKTWIGDATVSSFFGNGLILATPTGSTGYSLSSGGPIVHPDMDALVLTPVCPHSLSLRPLVVPGDQAVTVQVQVQAAHSDIRLTADGHTVCELKSQERVQVQRAPEPVRLINLHRLSFYELLRRKLDWSLDRREEKE